MSNSFELIRHKAPKTNLIKRKGYTTSFDYVLTASAPIMAMFMFSSCKNAMQLRTTLQNRRTFCNSTLTKPVEVEPYEGPPPRQSTFSRCASRDNFCARSRAHLLRAGRTSTTYYIELLRRNSMQKVPLNCYYAVAAPNSITMSVDCRCHQQ